MRVSGFLGSPRMGGNTEILMQEVLRVAKEQGAETELVVLNEKNIRGCQACMACRKTHRCAVDDDMQSLYPFVQKADGFVMGFPIFFFQMTSQMKAFLDRLFSLYNPVNPHSLGKGKPLTLVVTQGAPEPVFDAYIEQTKAMLGFIGFNVIDVIVARNVGARGDVRNQEEVMAAAALAGEKLAKAMQAAAE